MIGRKEDLESVVQFKNDYDIVRETALHWVVRDLLSEDVSFKL